MDLTEHLAILGGAATRAVIVERCGRGAFERGVREGTLVRLARGRYALKSAEKGAKAATRWGGVISWRSAAQLHGWGQRLVPERPDVTFPRNHHLPREARRQLVPHWSVLRDGDVIDGVTTKERTLVDCLRNLPVIESLPIVDSAIRCGDFTHAEIFALATAMKGRGRARALAVARLASAKPANAYESTLRAIAVQVPGLQALPQVEVQAGGRALHPDLYDEALGLVVEAESFEWHGKKAALTRDCWRYNAFVLAGKVVIRFSWTQVIFEPDYVFDVLVQVVALFAATHANVARGSPGRAA